MGGKCCIRGESYTGGLVRTFLVFELEGWPAPLLSLSALLDMVAA